jgi:hypothetical protein
VQPFLLGTAGMAVAFVGVIVQFVLDRLIARHRRDR